MADDTPSGISERLSAHSTPIPECGCQVWFGATTANGYGAVTVKGKQVGAHRAAWIVANGPIPDRLQVLHRCDVRCCINVDHLFLGTQKDNMVDMGAKGRKARQLGSASGNAKLKESDVLAIRADTRLWKEISAQYKIDISNVGKIKSRRNWAHLP